MNKKDTKRPSTDNSIDGSNWVNICLALFRLHYSGN